MPTVVHLQLKLKPRLVILPFQMNISKKQERNYLRTFHPHKTPTDRLHMSIVHIHGFRFKIKKCFSNSIFHFFFLL